jgi:hypothetical protein
VNTRRVAVALVGILFAMPACFAGEVALDVASRVEGTNEAIDGPEIDVYVRSHGGDAIDVFLEDSASDRRAIAEGVAAWLGFPGRIAHEHPFFPDTSTIELDERLIEPASGDEWMLDLDTAGLTVLLRTTGYTEAALVLCTPAVETRLRASRPPDLEFSARVCDTNVRGWALFTSDAPLRVRATFVPEPAHYLAYAAAVLLGTILFGALAWWIGDRLRRGPFRRRSGASVAIGLIGGGFALAGLAVVTGVVGALAGPADNLALSRDFTFEGFVSAVLWPALLAAGPGVIFATQLIRRRPWADDAPLSSTPPGAPGWGGRPPPPSLPWSG